VVEAVIIHPDVYCQVVEIAKQLMDTSVDCCQIMKKLKNVLSCGSAIIDAFIGYELVFQRRILLLMHFSWITITKNLFIM